MLEMCSVFSSAYNADTGVCDINLRVRGVDKTCVAKRARLGFSSKLWTGIIRTAEVWGIAARAQAN